MRSELMRRPGHTKRHVSVSGILLVVSLVGFVSRPRARAAVSACPPPAGSIDGTFFRAPEPASFEGASLRTVELPDRKLLVGIFGALTTGGSEPIEHRLLARLNADGTMDPSFTFDPGGA